MNLHNYFPTLSNTPLFKGITETDLSNMLNCLGAQIASFKKGQIIISEGELPKFIGIVLSGRVHIYKDDISGNRSLVDTLGESRIFNEAICCAAVSQSPITVEANTDCKIMILRFNRLLHSCPNSCKYHQRLIENMLKTVAQNNLFLQRRMELIQARTIRAKVMGYLNGYSKGRKEFFVPHNREQMAAYLCVERSALSHELIRMKADGLIDYNKNRFKFLD